MGEKLFCHHHLHGRLATWAWRGPWALIFENSRDFMALGGAAAEEAGARDFFNLRGRNPLSPELEEKWGLLNLIRTWFINNWTEWEWPVDFSDEMEKLATAAIEISHKNESREDVQLMGNNFKKIS